MSLGHILRKIKGFLKPKEHKEDPGEHDYFKRVPKPFETKGFPPNTTNKMRIL